MRCVRAGNRRWGGRSPPRRCNRRRSARFPARSTQWLKSQALDRQSAGRAAAARRARLGARGRDRARLLPRGRVRGRPRCDRRSAGELRRRTSGRGERAAPGAPLRPRIRAAPRTRGQGAGRRRTCTRCSSSVFAAESLAEALRMRRGLAAGQSVVTRDGIWLGADWLRLSRDRRAAHRRDRARGDRCARFAREVSRLEAEVKDGERQLERAASACANTRIGASGCRAR